MVSAGDGLVMPCGNSTEGWVMGNRMKWLYICHEGVYCCEMIFTFLLISS